MHCTNSRCFEDTCQGECEEEQRAKRLAEEAVKRTIKEKNKTLEPMEESP